MAFRVKKTVAHWSLRHTHTPSKPLPRDRETHAYHLTPSVCTRRHLDLLLAENSILVCHQRLSPSDQKGNMLTRNIRFEAHLLESHVRSPILSHTHVANTVGHAKHARTSSTRHSSSLTVRGKKIEHWEKTFKKVCGARKRGSSTRSRSQCPQCAAAVAQLVAVSVGCAAAVTPRVEFLRLLDHACVFCFRYASPTSPSQRILCLPTGPLLPLQKLCPWICPRPFAMWRIACIGPHTRRELTSRPYQSSHGSNRHCRGSAAFNLASNHLRSPCQIEEATTHQESGALCEGTKPSSELERKMNKET